VARPAPAPCRSSPGRPQPLNPGRDGRNQSPEPQTRARPRRSARERDARAPAAGRIPDPEPPAYHAYPHAHLRRHPPPSLIAIRHCIGPGRFLLCDEPTTSPTSTSRSQILAATPSFAQNAPVAVSSPRPRRRPRSPSRRRRSCTRGASSETAATPPWLLAAPRHPYTSGLLAAALDWTTRIASRSPSRLASGPATTYEWLQFPAPLSVRDAGVRDDRRPPRARRTPARRRHACTRTCSRPLRQLAAMADALIESTTYR